MKFLIDNMLSPALVQHFRARGHTCDHVVDLHLDEADDEALWAHGVREGAILVSKDENFVFLANRPGDAGRLIWVRLGNCRNPALLAAFDGIHLELTSSLDAGLRIIEVR